MNEETDTPETLADIIAEMRRFAAFAAGRSRITPAPSLAAEQECHAAKLTKYADRLEAAAKREYAETKAYFEKLHDGPSMICTAKNCAVRNIGLSIAAAPRKFDESAPGNAAAMREALKAIDENTDLLDIAEGVAPNLHPSHSFVAVQIRKIVRAALAALIVDAVNERDRLRDIVRRLSRHLANYITSESENDLLREARAAIGEGETPTGKGVGV